MTSHRLSLYDRDEIAEPTQIAHCRKKYIENRSVRESCSSSLSMFLRVSWDTEEDDERKGRGCMLQYQHSLIRVLTVFTADSPDPSGPSPVYFLGPDWQVDVTGLVRYFLKMGDMTVARLQAGNVLAGRAAGVTTLQVMVAYKLCDLYYALKYLSVLISVTIQLVD